MSLSRSNASGGASTLGQLGSLDPVLLLVSLALTAFGILAVYIAGADDREAYALNQTLGFGVGLIGAVPLALMDYRRLQRYLTPLYCGAIFMLLMVVILGATAKGAQRWIDVGPVQFQPAEFA
jgi:rod shape determining protein RodA